MALKIFTGAADSKFVAADYKGFGDLVAQVSRDTGVPINSCNREKRAEPLLHRIGKMSQEDLWECSQNCQPRCHGNCNPANPPGYSTHELRSDGVAYRWIPRGRRLRWYMQGIDVAVWGVHKFIAEMGRRGYVVTQTYPSSAAEAQHVNFRKRPKINLWKVRPLRKGMRGRRVREVVKLLRSIQEPGELTPYLTGKGKLGARPYYTKTRRAAVRRFQRDHHIKADGVVGYQTIHLMRRVAKRPPSRLDKAGVAFIAGFEGEILHLYNDPAGFATFGIGHLVARKKWELLDAATKRKYGTPTHPLPRKQARALSRELFAADARRFERAVMKYVPERWRKSHDRFNALTSASLNLGEEVLTASPPLTSLGEALKGKRVKRVCSALKLYDKADGVTLPGLTRRRAAECALIRRNK